MGTYYEDRAEKTDEELVKGYECLEPEYSRGHVIAEKVMAQFQDEHFKPLAKKVADHISEYLWDMLRDSLLSDTEMNLESHMRHRIESSIKALLGGNQWAINKYVMDKYQEGIQIRKTLAALIPAELQEARAKDMENEIATLKEDLVREREYNRRSY